MNNNKLNQQISLKYKMEIKNIKILPPPYDMQFSNMEDGGSDE